MRGVFVIAWRDIRSLVTSPTFFVVGFFATLIWSFSYANILYQFDHLLSQPPQLSAQLGPRNLHLRVFGNFLASSVHLVMIMAIPALTMKLLTEEKKQRTYDLLLTAPISATQIALGKFLAGWGVSMVLVSISQLYPLMTSLFVDFPLAPLISSCFGFSLLIGAYVSIGLFASSLTSSVMLSVIFGVLLNITILVVSAMAEKIDDPLWMEVIDHASLANQLETFLTGNLQTQSVIFFFSFISFFVFLTQRIIESTRWR